MNSRITNSLERLRDAIYEAINRSEEITDAMEALAEAGFNSALFVDVALAPAAQEPPSVTYSEVTASDTEFLHSVGITAAEVPQG